MINRNDPIKAIVGLGNPGHRFESTRHNVGFLVLDSLAQKYDVEWKKNDLMEYAEISNSDDETVLLIKPQTFMNESGKVMPALMKKGIGPEHVLVVHDELDFPFGKIGIKEGGSARGHNGLRSIIEYVGEDFARIRCGIGRPDDQEDVPQYVLGQFDQSDEQVSELVESAIDMIEKFL
jgi:PTH1 family peptidyl-tRNA hydrolase